MIFLKFLVLEILFQDVSDKVRFNFHSDQNKFNHEFYAIQNQYPLILGMDFITKWHGVLDFEHSKIRLKDEIYDLIPPPKSALGNI